MGTARDKLNGAYFCGSLLAAAAIGGMTESWLNFLIAATIFVSLNVQSGEIR